MIESLLDVPTSDGVMDVFVTHPETGGPFPGVVLFMDVWGLREELFDIARKVAVTGCYCAVPNFYYRDGRVRFELRDEHGRMLSIDRIPDEMRTSMRAQMARVSDEMAMKDVGALLAHLRRQPVADGPKGAIGYCLGGRYVIQAAALYPADFQAVASLHGTRLVTEAPLSPYTLADKCRGEVYCAFGERDGFAPESTRRALAQAFGENPNVVYRPVVHGGADHGYALPDRDVFDKQAANRDWENIFAMFDRVLRR